MDRQSDLQLMYSVMGCVSRGEKAGPGCGSCPYLIDVEGQCWFCDVKAITEDVRVYLTELQVLMNDKC